MTKTTIRETVVGKQKYRITSHYVGDKNIKDVMEEYAIRKALYEYNYNGGFKKEKEIC